MAKRKPITPTGTPEADYLPATMSEIMGASYLKALPALDTVALTCAFGPAVDPGDDTRYGPTWAAKDPAGNTWSVYTRLGTWHLSGRGVLYPSKPLHSTTNRFVAYLLAHCKEGRG